MLCVLLVCGSCFVFEFAVSFVDCVGWRVAWYFAAFWFLVNRLGLFMFLFGWVAGFG